MSFKLRYPNITAKTEKEQIKQMVSFLRQLTDQLNWALNAIEVREPARSAEPQNDLNTQ